MNTPLKYAALTAAFLISLCAAYSAHAYFFFGSELRHQGISEFVRVENRTYAVENGVVFSEGDQVVGITALRALRVAYGKALAERSPLMGLEGTDPDALRTHTTLLKKTMEEMSLFQKTDEDATLVRDALYPIDFLYALSTLESARKQFIASGSELDLHSYQQSFDSVFRYGIQDSKRLIDAFAYEMLSTRPPKTVGFAGTMTATSTALSLASIPDSLARIQTQAKKRSLCLFGVIWMCPPLSLRSVEILTTEPLHAKVVGTRPTFEREIASIFRLATTTNRYEKLYASVNLEESTCLASLPPPYHMEAGILLDINFDLLHYLDDMYFLPTAGEHGPVLEFLRDEYGLRYLKMNPMAFYLCPHLIEDVSIAQATLQTVALAKNYSDVPNSYRAVLLSGVPDSKNAAAYIREATDRIQREPLPAGYLQEVLSVALMFTQRSVRLDAVVAHIADINTHTLKLVQEGAPFDVRAKTLLYTHTAAASLFLFHQTGASSPLVPNTPDDWENFNKKIKLYSNLHTNITDDVLIRQIRTMKNIEKNGL